MKSKKTAKPMFSVKRDFVDSLDAMLQEAVMFLQVVDIVLQTGGDFKGSDALRERAAMFRKTLSSDD